MRRKLAESPLARSVPTQASPPAPQIHAASSASAIGPKHETACAQLDPAAKAEHLPEPNSVHCVSGAAALERLHGLPPVVNAETRLLILGSFPGARSLAERRYYAHPQNQFWRLVQDALGPAAGPDVVQLQGEARLQCLLDWGVGLWDVYGSCERQGSLDSAIRNPELNDFVVLAQRLPNLQGLAFNGGESWKHHKRVAQVLDLPMWRLPSSSPAHASWTLAHKAAVWREVFGLAGLGLQPRTPG